MCRNSGPTSEEYKAVRMLSQKFDELFDRSMDLVRGLGGTADLGYLHHGPTWSAFPEETPDPVRNCCVYVRHC